MLSAAKGPVVRVPCRLLRMQKAVRVKDRSIGAPNLLIIVQEAIGHQDVAICSGDFTIYTAVPLELQYIQLAANIRGKHFT